MNKLIHTSGKRKRAIARATLYPGTGIVTVNGIALNVYQPAMYRMRIQEPLLLAGDLAQTVDLRVNVFGGGISSQADASRLVIAKALVQHTKDKKLRQQFLSYDRQLLVADVRRKEPAKPNRHSQARAKVQKSYR